MRYFNLLQLRFKSVELVSIAQLLVHISNLIQQFSSSIVILPLGLDDNLLLFLRLFSPRLLVLDESGAFY